MNGQPSAARSVAIGVGKGLAWGIPVAFGLTAIWWVLTLDMDTGTDYNTTMFYVLAALALVISVRNEFAERSGRTRVSDQTA